MRVPKQQRNQTSRAVYLARVKRVRPASKTNCLLDVMNVVLLIPLWIMAESAPNGGVNINTLKLIALPGDEGERHEFTIGQAHGNSVILARFKLAKRVHVVVKLAKVNVGLGNVALFCDVHNYVRVEDGD